MKSNDIIDITSELLKDKKSLLSKLKSSFKNQKNFIKSLFKNLTKYLNCKQNNKLSKEFSSLIKELLISLKLLVSNLGIPFVHHLLNSSDDILNVLLNLYYELDDLFDSEQNYVKELLEKSIDILNFSMYYEDINKLKAKLVDLEIIDDKERTNIVTKEQELFENIFNLMNKWNNLKNECMTADFLSSLIKDYNSIMENISHMPSNKDYPAQEEFYKELMIPFEDYLNEKKMIVKNIPNGNNKVNNNMDKEIENITNQKLENRTFFFLDEVIKEDRGQCIEFKNYSLPLTQDNRRDIKRHICSFLNSQGGRLYLGINDQKKVKGIVLNYKERDDQRNQLINLIYTFYPKCRINKVSFYFIPIKEMKTKKFISKRYVLKIKVLKGDDQMLYSFSNVGYHSTMRKNAECIDLDAKQIYEEIEKREEKKYKIKEEINNVNENKDPEPEVNLLDLEDNKDNSLNTPLFGENNLCKCIAKLSIDNKPKKEKNKKQKNNKNMVREDTITVKITNIDENESVNDVNRKFNGCGCATQKILKGYGYLNFSKMEHAMECIKKFNGYLIGSKKIKLKIQKNKD